MVFSAAACGLWLACALRALRTKGGPSLGMQAGLVISAVPLVGFLTYFQGPLFGLGALILVTLVLSLHYLPRLHSTRPRDGEQG